MNFKPFQTPQTRATWYVAVASRQTELGLDEWTAALTAEAFLRLHGFYVGERDMNINAAHDGAFMVSEYYVPGVVSKDASDGPWAIVGDDKDALIKEALDVINFFYEEPTELENV
jgi:hypothetical protein